MRVDVSGRHFIFPSECACCGGPADTELAASASREWGKRVVHTETKSWDIPYCTRCTSHIASYEEAGSLARILTVLSVVVGGAIVFMGNPFWGIAIGIILVIGTVMVFARSLTRARSLCSDRCAIVGRAVAYLGWDSSVHKFEMSSQHFAVSFMDSNRSKLVNLSVEAIGLLSDNGPKTLPTAARSPRRYIS